MPNGGMKSESESCESASHFLGSRVEDTDGRGEKNGSQGTQRETSQIRGDRRWGKKPKAERKNQKVMEIHKTRKTGRGWKNQKRSLFYSSGYSRNLFRVFGVFLSKSASSRLIRPSDFGFLSDFGFRIFLSLGPETDKLRTC